MKLKLISCEVFYREMCAAVARSPNQVDLLFLPKGLHSLGSAAMRARIQAAVDAVDPARYEAVLLGYGLCNNGLHGIEASGLPLVLPRAHDCITLFFGGRQRYLDYFRRTPGVYFKTSGWIERGETDEELKQISIEHLAGMDLSLEELRAKYGDDNAQYLYETLVQNTPHYGQITFIEMGVEPDDRFVRQAVADAEERGWAFEKVRGDMRLIQDLVNGRWDPGDFLTVPRGGRICARYHEGVVDAEKAVTSGHGGLGRFTV